MPLRLHLLPRPYDAVSGPVQPQDLNPDLAAEGTLLVFRVDHPDADADGLASATLALRGRHPGLPFVLWAACPRRGDVLRAAARARLFGIRAVMARPVPDLEVLRRQLTDADDLREQVLRWLAETGRVADPRALHFLGRVFDAARRCRTVAAVARALRVSPRALSKRFGAAGLGTPKPFIRMPGRLQDALALQADPRVSVQDIARALGYADRNPLRNATTSTFALSPTRVRALLGPEPLLAAWAETTRFGGGKIGTIGS